MTQVLTYNLNFLSPFTVQAIVFADNHSMEHLPDFPHENHHHNSNYHMRHYHRYLYFHLLDDVDVRNSCSMMVVMPILLFYSLAT